MRRRHLFEWEDQPWLPVVFRDFITDHLRYFLNRKDREPTNRAIARLIQPLLKASDANCIIDLCAGAGGPLLQVRRILSDELQQPVGILLTDLYPNVTAFKRMEQEGGGAIVARYESTDALDVPRELVGLKTLFTSLHHFPPTLVQSLLADAARKGQPIAAFELLERNYRMLFLTGLCAIIQAFGKTPWVGRLTLSRLFFTYVIPLAPAIFFWDGMVSVFRTYTPQELRQFADSVGATGYQWETGRFDAPGPFGIKLPTIYLLGWPIRSEKHSEADGISNGIPQSGVVEEAPAFGTKS